VGSVRLRIVEGYVFYPSTVGKRRARWRRWRHLQENHPSLARWPASPAAAARWRGASVAFPLGSKAGAFHKGQGERSFSPWWPRDVVQALVKKGGAARRHGGRQRRCDDVEAGALDDGGTVSSHGRLRSSRRTACPRVASNASFSPHFSFSSGVQVCGQGSGFP
jgi:hypothetical protein